MDQSELRALLETQPRANLGFFPTPLHALPNLSRTLGGPDIYIKREDMSGLALGGNKVRMLEFVLGHALECGADTFIAGGGKLQSNHARLCAAGARACGLDPVIVVSDDRTVPGAMQGNLLLDFLTGTDLRIAPDDALDLNAPSRFRLQPVMERLAEASRERGKQPYVLPTSSVPRATLGFVDCGIELADQFIESGITEADIFLTSTGSTQAGLLLVARALGLPWHITGVSCAPIEAPRENVVRLANGAAEILGLSYRFGVEDVLNVDFSGKGYGVLDAPSREALSLLAIEEGLLLDPVYTAKGMAAAIAHARTAQSTSRTPIVFVHTGGTPTLFAYADQLTEGNSYFSRFTAGGNA